MSVITVLTFVAGAAARRGQRLDAAEQSHPHCEVCGTRIPSKFGVAVCAKPRCVNTSLARHDTEKGGSSG